MPKVKVKIRVKGIYITLLKQLNHQQAGSIADNLDVNPPVVRSHIEKNTPTLLRADWQREIRRVLVLDPSTELNEDCTIDVQ